MAWGLGEALPPVNLTQFLMDVAQRAPMEFDEYVLITFQDGWRSAVPSLLDRVALES
jgi:hypothetical protein